MPDVPIGVQRDGGPVLVGPPIGAIRFAIALYALPVTGFGFYPCKVGARDGHGPALGRDVWSEEM
jgi:hypothetical protein